ncbi:hypothetical protein CTAYLR_000915 [Chrysophaeum taylorii]|uniref:Exoribonuclease phosphorolytic domain-containing protein n=1 Tax=Chrysophaeum taylorii TaxID=2483200 RepID=A0AAD7UH51_9STRA|nr:hypothetical protein CTAYLR_000915 [Chrysophaeum taylorii]
MDVWFDVSGLRKDGRKPRELRAMDVKLGGPKPPNVDGCAWLRMGLTSVLAHCIGPSETKRRSDEVQDAARVSCTVVRGRREDPELATTVVRTLETAVLVDAFPRATISVVLHVLADEGSRLACCLNAASLALVDAGIPMRDCLGAAAAGLVADEVFFDLTRDEERRASAKARFTVAVLPRSRRVVSAHLDGAPLETSTFEKLLSRAIDAATLAANRLAQATRDHVGEAIQMRDATAATPPSRTNGRSTDTEEVVLLEKMIYDVKSAYFASFLSSSKHLPTTDEVVEALGDIKKKTPGLSPEDLAAALRTKYPSWLLDDMNWTELAEKMGD